MKSIGAEFNVSLDILTDQDARKLKKIPRWHPAIHIRCKIGFDRIIGILGIVEVNASMRESLNAIFEQLHAKNTVTVGQERDEHVAHLVYMQTTIIGSPTWHLMLQEGGDAVIAYCHFHRIHTRLHFTSGFHTQLHLRLARSAWGRILVSRSGYSHASTRRQSSFA